MRCGEPKVYLPSVSRSRLEMGGVSITFAVTISAMQLNLSYMAVHFCGITSLLWIYGVTICLQGSL